MAQTGAKKTKRQNEFISHYLQNGRNELATCKALGIGRTTVRHWKKDPEFVSKLEERDAAVTSELEKYHEILRQALPQALKAAVFDPSFTKHVMQVLFPDQWDVNLRRERALRQLEKDVPLQPLQINLVAESKPERLAEVKGEKKDAA